MYKIRKLLLDVTFVNTMFSIMKSFSSDDLLLLLLLLSIYVPRDPFQKRHFMMSRFTNRKPINIEISK